MAIKRFLEIERKLAAGEASQISLTKNSSEIVSYFLRAFRGRNDLSDVVKATAKSDPFLSRLEIIRTYLRANKLQEALAIIAEITPTNELEESELQLEKCRYHLFRSDWQKVLDLSEPLLGLSFVAAQTKMTLFQIRGLAFMKLNRFEEAIQDLKVAISFSEFFPEASSGFVAHTVSIHAHACAGKREQAQSLLDQTESLLHKVDDVDAWTEKKMQQLRARFHFANHFGSKQEAFEFLTEAHELAKWLDLKTTEAMCESDMRDFSTYRCEVIRKFDSWTYLPRLRLILWLNPKTAVRTDQSELTHNMIELLAKQPRTQDELFESLWGIKLKNEYENHLRSILSKVRSKLPPGSILLKSKTVSLK